MSTDPDPELVRRVKTARPYRGSNASIVALLVGLALIAVAWVVFGR